MLSLTVRLAFVLAMLTVGAGGSASAAMPDTVARLPAAQFFAAPQFGSARLSPDGKRLALQVRGAGERDALLVIEFDTKASHVAASFTDADITTFRWVNNERLVYAAGDTRYSNRVYSHGIFATNADGSKRTQLVANYRNSRAPLPFGAVLYSQVGAPDTDSVYMMRQKNGGRSSQRELLLVNTVTAEITRIASPENTTGWLFDNQGQLRMLVTENDGEKGFQYRDSGADPWRPAPGMHAKSMRGTKLLAFGAPGSLLVETANGKDKAAVYALDIASGTLAAQPLIVTKDYDFAGSLVMDKDRLLGFRVRTDAESTIWTDPAMKALQQEVDQLQPSTVNLITPPLRPQAPWVLVESYSDRQPRIILVYNTTTKAFTKVGETYPAIRSGQMGRQETVYYKARDGRTIPALLTRPAGEAQGPAPMLVLVHGGPWTAAHTWGWRAETQFLASRGYAVLEPAFRGTTGLGYAHFKAGFKQWGRAMQDDLADGAKWAIEQGIAAPKRICIGGGSYGGYATLMGLVNDPELFRCGIDWVGVTDIKLLYENHWGYESDASEHTLTVSLPQMVGDPATESARLEAVSPLAQAARIHQPLLLAYGELDKRVPLFHGIKFRDAVKKTNADVEWVVYPGEGHGWVLQNNRIDFWTRVEKFLDRNIGQ